LSTDVINRVITVIIIVSIYYGGGDGVGFGVGLVMALLLVLVQFVLSQMFSRENKRIIFNKYKSEIKYNL
jgi:hypothetical protein